MYVCMYVCRLRMLWWGMFCSCLGQQHKYVCVREVHAKRNAREGKSFFSTYIERVVWCLLVALACCGIGYFLLLHQKRRREQETRDCGKKEARTVVSRSGIVGVARICILETTLEASLLG